MVRHDLCNKVSFSVPIDGNMASKLFFEAASNAPPRAGEAEHPGDTPGIQTPADAGADSVAIPQEACKTSGRWQYPEKCDSQCGDKINK